MKRIVPESKFKQGVKVRMKSNTKKIGEIVTVEQNYKLKNGVEEYKEKYFIKWGAHDSRWHDAKDLSPEYEFLDSFERELADLMVNVNLKYGTNERVEAHFEDKKRYMN
ncbi:hypothetical protein [Halobacillus litoralis]|uniref:hypothetical protein n=1 Tax=Halobacillus litoralis TaxID=45668 RepID=UPI001CD38BED|nr:hypothetical protein [Halobacillus litoralis]MCA1021498.1 hypothetical protein [Halobacillus litoralis]